MIRRRGAARVANRFLQQVAASLGVNYLSRGLNRGAQGRNLRGMRQRSRKFPARGTGGPKRVFRRGRRPARIRKKYGKQSRKSKFMHYKYGQLGGSITFSTVAAGRLAVAAQGAQFMSAGVDWDYTASTTLCSLLGAAQLQAIHDGVSVQPVDDAVPNAVPAAGTYQQPDRSLLREAKAETIMTSASSENVFYELYYCQARHDIPAGIFTGPNDIINKGFTEAASSVGTINAGGLSQTPFQSNTFCRMFKVYKVKKGMLRSGQSVRFSLTRSKDMLLDVTRWTYKNALTGGVAFTRMVEMLAGLSKIVLIRMWSGPMADTTVNTNVSIGTCAVDFVTKYRFIVNTIVSGSNINRGLPSTYAGTSTDSGKTGLSLQNMGEATDAKVPEVDV